MSKNKTTNMMARSSSTITSAIVLFVLLCLIPFLCVRGENAKTMVQVYHERSKLNFSISFEEDGFEEFYKCLCSKSARSCTVFYNLDNDHIGTRNKTQLSSYHSSFYECRTILLRSLSSLVCTRFTEEQLSEFSSADAFQNFRFAGAKSCDFQCVGIMGKAGQSIHVVRDTHIKPCGDGGDDLLEESEDVTDKIGDSPEDTATVGLAGQAVDDPMDKVIGGKKDHEDEVIDDSKPKDQETSDSSMDVLLVIMYVISAVVIVIVACFLVYLIRRRLRQKSETRNSSATGWNPLKVDGTSATLSV